MQLHTFSAESEWINAAVAEIVKDLPPEKEFSLALSGGKTPLPVYRELAKQNLNWPQAEVFQVDERFITPDRPDSNAFLILRNFVEYLPEAAGKFYFFETGGSTWEESAQQYNELLQQYGKPFDVCILGIGPDGHTASLFPHEPAIYETEKLATTSETNQFAVWKRMTLTLPVILNSKKIIILLQGKEKKEVLEELRHGKKSWEDFPAQKLAEHENVHIFFLEE